MVSYLSVYLSGAMNVLQRLGYALRETGQALDRVGSFIQGNYAFREQRELMFIHDSLC